MNEIAHAFILSLIQGITEFLPVSSSAHLVLLPKLFGWQDQGLAFDVATHVGTLSAVLYYYRRELQSMTLRWLQSVQQRQLNPEARFVWILAFATIPVGLAGIFFNDFIATNLRSSNVIAATTIIFGILLGFAGLRGNQAKLSENLSWQDVALIGCAQALALIPGVSRSGVTLTACLLLGMRQQAAAQLAFLLSIPVIVLAGGLQLYKLITQEIAINWPTLCFAYTISAISGLICIKVFMRLLTSHGLLPFVCYRILLGIGVAIFL